MSSRAIYPESRLWGEKVSCLFQTLGIGQKADRSPGKNDGQVIMIKNNGQVEAYQVSYHF